jgi:rhodanese-related sulfurtransferase
VTTGLAAPPEYFPINARINKEGYDSLDQVLAAGLKPLSVAEFKALAKKSVIIDSRRATEFTQGFVPGSISIGLEGRYAEWGGSLLPFDQPLLIVTDPGKERESVIRLARVGFDKFRGYLDGGYEAWQKAGEEIDLIIDIEPDELMMDLPHDDNIVVLDVRGETEYADGHVAGAVNLPLGNMKDPGSMANIQETDNLYVHCAGGYRSVIAASLLKRQGIHNLRNVLGGWGKIKEQENVEVVKEKSVLN